ncbi:MAG TPA: NADH-quinone oxidoreductase subunit J [Candidatus Binatia bacterium]|nr:NADH-quinone oxidoreductase subunit J [Candidatus Binatia bacterium]
MPRVAFLLIAALAVASALGLVLRRNPIHGALFLVVNLGCIAALYLMLGAEFLAAAQVIVYAGAIMVLFVFAIMVLIPGKEETGPDPRRGWRLLAAPLGAALLVELAVILLAGQAATAPAAAPAPAGGVAAIGRLLFTDYLLPFELTSVLLLAAMVGVLLLARRRA